jgi:hypothetical protein
MHSSLVEVAVVVRGLAQAVAEVVFVRSILSIFLDFHQLP